LSAPGPSPARLTAKGHARTRLPTPIAPCSWETNSQTRSPSPVYALAKFGARRDDLTVDLTHRAVAAHYCNVISEAIKYGVPLDFLPGGRPAGACDIGQAQVREHWDGLYVVLVREEGRLVAVVRLDRDGSLHVEADDSDVHKAFDWLVEDEYISARRTTPVEVRG